MAQLGPKDVVEPLARLLERRLGWTLVPESLARLTGGAVQNTWAFDAQVPGAINPKRMIFRQLAGQPLAVGENIGPEVEAALIAAAAARGAPVPAIHYVVVPEDGIGRGFLSERIDGETLGGRIVKSDRFNGIRPELAVQCGRILARIHSIPIDEIPKLELKSALRQVDDLKSVYVGSPERSPIFEVAFRWLYGNLPPEPAEFRFVHGDFRNGNLIIGEEGIRAVLDWELAHIGDPAEDIGWITVNSWRFGMPKLEVGGFGTLDQLLEGYRAEGGIEIARDHALFWRAFGSLKWGIMCREMARTHPDQPVLSVERALIGRRTSETEFDLLDIFESVR